jgi:hypothetical protein
VLLMHAQRGSSQLGWRVGGAVYPCGVPPARRPSPAAGLPAGHEPGRATGDPPFAWHSRLRGRASCQLAGGPGSRHHLRESVCLAEVGSGFSCRRFRGTGAAVAPLAPRAGRQLTASMVWSGASWDSCPQDAPVARRRRHSEASGEALPRHRPWSPDTGWSRRAGRRRGTPVSARRPQPTTRNRYSNRTYCRT